MVELTSAEVHGRCPGKAWRHAGWNATTTGRGGAQGRAAESRREEQHATLRELSVHATSLSRKSWCDCAKNEMPCQVARASKAKGTQDDVLGVRGTWRTSGVCEWVESGKAQVGRRCRNAKSSRTRTKVDSEQRTVFELKSGRKGGRQGKGCRRRLSGQRKRRTAADDAGGKNRE